MDQPKRRMALHWKIVIGLVLGIVVGVVLAQTWTAETWRAIGVGDAAAFMARRPGDLFAAGKPSEANQDAGVVAHAVRIAVNANTFVGQLFFRLLRFIAVPIVLFSLAVGVASLGDLKRLGRIGARTVAIFVVTTALAIGIGLALANLVRPGHHLDEASRARLVQEYTARTEQSIQRTVEVPTPWKQALDTIPGNPFEALATAMMPAGTIPGQGSMLQVIAVALLLGVGLTMIPAAKADPVVRFFDAMTDVIVKLVELVMRMAPVAVFALVAPAIVLVGLDVLRALGVYSLVLVAGLATAQFIMYPLLLRFAAGYPVRRFFRGMAPAMLTAFSSSSSSATLPVTIRCVMGLGVSERIASFVCPLGATINMAGTAMYMGVAAAFIAQMYNADLTFSQQATVVVMATLAAIGTPGIPGAGVVMLVVVLNQIGVRPEGIAVLLGVDRLLDMCRTVVNISGDAATAVVVARAEGELAAEGVRS